jgi:hypothetical protein
MSLHSDTLIRANKFLLFLLNAAYLTDEATDNNFIVYGLIRPGLELTIYHTRGEHANHYTTDAVSRYDDHTTELYNIGLGLLCLTPLSLSVLFVEEN